MTSRRNPPNTRVDSANSVPGFVTLTWYLRKSGMSRSRSNKPPLACGFALMRRSSLGGKSESFGISLPLSSNNSSGR